MAQQPASIRYKNPGAMWGGDFATKWGAQKGAVKLNDGTGQGNTIAVFPTFVDGIAAQVALWRAPRYANKKFKDAIVAWSGGNNVPSYIKLVAKSVPGFTGETVIDDAFLKGPLGIEFLKAQARHEAGKVYPAPDEDFIAGRDKAFRTTLQNIKGKVIANARIVGGVVVGGGSLVVQAATGVTETPGVTVEAVKTWTDNAGQIAGSIKTVVDYVPPTLFGRLVKLVASPTFLAVALAVVLASWALSWWLRRNEGPK